MTYFVDGDLSEDSVISKMETTAVDDKKYMMKYYNLDAVISVGYRCFMRWSRGIGTGDTRCRMKDEIKQT